MHILVTGAAGFIGFHAARALLAQGHSVVGVDNLNDYYDVSLKRARLALLQAEPGFRFALLELADAVAVRALIGKERPQYILHLAAQAGVRYSLEHPEQYIESNLLGFYALLEAIRAFPPEHFVFASSSSVYGLNMGIPFSENDHTDHPASLYAATKKSNELLAHSYSHLFRLPVTGLRFFTVYGPWGRPDMAIFSFTRKIFAGEPIQIFNNGFMRRDFTYIDDIVDGVVRTLLHPATPDGAWDACSPLPSSSSAPYCLYNIGNSQSVALEDFITTLETAIGKKAIREYLPMQAGDVVNTYADIQRLQTALGFSPNTSIDVGVPRFVAWFKDYYGLA